MFLVALASLMLEGLDCGGGSDLWNVSKTKYAVFKKVSAHLRKHWIVLPQVGELIQNASYSETSRLLLAWVCSSQKRPYSYSIGDSSVRLI